MRNKLIRNMTLAAMFIVLGILLPFLTVSNPQLGSMFLLMHIPVLFAGLLIDYKYGAIVGIITPLLRSVTFAMPILMPVALAMAFELGAYGFFIGLAHKVLPKKIPYVFVSLLIALLLGRAVWGVAAWIFYPAAGFNYSLKIFVTAAFVTGLPGIGIQLVLIPTIYIYLTKSGLLRKINGENQSIESADSNVRDEA